MLSIKLERKTTPFRVVGKNYTLLLICDTVFFVALKWNTDLLCGSVTSTVCDTSLIYSAIRVLFLRISMGGP